MGLLGDAALVIWHDIADGYESDYKEWHAKEHMTERVGLPGFLRGHAGWVVSGAPQGINLYEVEEMAALTSDSYLERLNNPTPWSQRVMPYFRNNNRTLCRVVASAGDTIAGYLLSIQLTAATGAGDALSDWLCETMPALVHRRGIVGARYLEGDAEASRVDSREKQLRGEADAIADRVVLIGGYDADLAPAGVA